MPSLAAKRKLEPAKLSRLVRGDLDWIVMKCLEKERGRRYETANGLAADCGAIWPTNRCWRVRRGGYRLRKFVRRHKGGLLAASVLVLALLGGRDRDRLRRDRSRESTGGQFAAGGCRRRSGRGRTASARLPRPRETVEARDKVAVAAHAAEETRAKAAETALDLLAKERSKTAWRMITRQRFQTAHEAWRINRGPDSRRRSL